MIFLRRYVFLYLWYSPMRKSTIGSSVHLLTCGCVLEDGEKHGHACFRRAMAPPTRMLSWHRYISYTSSSPTGSWDPLRSAPGAYKSPAVRRSKYLLLSFGMGSSSLGQITAQQRPTTALRRRSPRRRRVRRARRASAGFFLESWGISGPSYHLSLLASAPLPPLAPAVGE